MRRRWRQQISGLCLSWTLPFFFFPANAQAQLQRAILELTINEVDKGEVVALVSESDVLLRVEDLQNAGLRGFSGRQETVGEETYVSLASLAPGLRFQLDERALALHLTAEPALLGTEVLALRSVRPAGIVYREDGSAFFNYALSLRDFDRLDGFGETGGSLRGKLLYTSFSARSHDGLLRGLTNLTWDNRERLVRWVFGDSFASGGALGGSLFLAGIATSREFNLDPYFVRFPGFGLSGAVTTPSRAEVYVNGTLVRQLELSPGRFELRDVPVTAGRGATRIVLKDVFGRTREISTPYYYATGTLGKGLSEYSYSLGFERENPGTESWDYGSLALLGRHRFGLTDSLTVGGRLEAVSGLVSGGPTVTARLPFGELELSGGASGGSGESGFAGSLGYSYLGSPASFGLRLQGVSSRYANLSLRASQDRPSFEVSTFGGLRASSRLNLTAQYGSAELRDRGRSERVSLSGSYRVSSRASTYLTAVRVGPESGRRKWEVFAGVSYYLGEYRTASASYQRTESAERGVFEVQKSLRLGPGFGYRLHGKTGPERGSGLVQYQNSFGRYEVSYERSGGQDFTTFSASGGIAVMGGGVFFSRPLQQSFALLQVPGVKGVGGFLNNQKVGETDARGNLLVPNLLPYYGNRLGIADQDVPMDWVIEKTEEIVAPPLRGGSLVRFPARQVQILKGKIVIEAEGQTRVPSYGELTVRVSGKDVFSPLGKQAEFYLESLPSGKHPARVEDQDGMCEFELSVPETDQAFVNLGAIRCVIPGESRKSP